MQLRVAPSRRHGAPAALAALGLALGVFATQQDARAQDDVLIYRCTDAKGAVTVQNGAPCAKGMKQEIRRVGVLPSLPPPTRREAPAEPELPPLASFELVMGPQTEPLPESSIPDGERGPPPALFQCKTWDEKEFLLEHGEPEPECAPLQTVGIGGVAGIANGQACEMRRAECTPLTDAALCTAWQRHVGEAQFRAKFANPDDFEPRKVEHARRAQLLADSNCPR